MKKNIKIFGNIILGCMLAAYALNNILLPNLLMTGGISGIAMIITRWIGLNIQLSIIILSLPIFVWAFFKYGFKQIFYALTSIILFTIFIGFAKLLPALKIDLVLAVLVSGIFFGISNGIVLRLGVACGTESLVAMYLKNKYGIAMGTFFTIFNIIVVFSSLLLPDATLNSVLYSMVSIYINGKVTDIIIMGFKRNFEVTIISEKYMEITEFIHKELHRGATFVQGLGTFNLQKKMLVKTLINNQELIALKEYVKEIDPLSFMYVNQSTEVIGTGFLD